MNEAVLWFLMTVGMQGQVTIHEVPYVVEWECQHQAEIILERTQHLIARSFCFSSSAIDVNAWNHSKAGKWRFTEYE